jgi:hypothetical protein
MLITINMIMTIKMLCYANTNANDNDNSNANDSLNMWMSVYDCAMVLLNSLVLADYRSVAIVLVMLVGYSDG